MWVTYLRNANKIKAFFQQPWQYTFSVIGIVILSLFLAISILLKIYGVFWLNIAMHEEIRKVSRIAMYKQIDVVSTTPLNVNQTNLFGTAVPKTLAPSNFVLLGIDFPDNNPSHAKAIIRINSGEDMVFGVGDSIQQGTVISEITPDKVYLTHNGIVQILDISWEPINENSEEDNQW